MILQLNPPLPMATPKGDGLCHVVIDYGPEHDLIWVVTDDATGEVWSWPNPKVRGQRNVTMGRSPVADAQPSVITPEERARAAEHGFPYSERDYATVVEDSGKRVLSREQYEWMRAKNGEVVKIRR